MESNHVPCSFLIMCSTGTTTVIGSSLLLEAKIVWMDTRIVGTSIFSIPTWWLILGLHIKPLIIFFNLEECHICWQSFVETILISRASTLILSVIKMNKAALVFYQSKVSICTMSMGLSQRPVTMTLWAPQHLQNFHLLCPSCASSQTVEHAGRTLV